MYVFCLCCTFALMSCEMMLVIGIESESESLPSHCRVIAIVIAVFKLALQSLVRFCLRAASCPASSLSAMRSYGWCVTLPW